jgi:hypothetical protein
MRVALLVVVVAACGSKPPPRVVEPAVAGNGCPSGHPFEDGDLKAWDSGEKEEAMDITIPPFDPMHGAGTADQIVARFRGKDRAGPKTTIVPGDPDDHDSVEHLQSALPKDDAMMNHTPPLTTKSNDRAAEEQHQVAVPAWIYAVKYEDDGDWHVIIGTDPSKKPIHYFNAEISGLPAKSAANYKRLAAVRKAFVHLLDDKPPGPSSYHVYKPPIAVDVEGSLFYDVDHPPGAVGPKDMKPTTAWEIHPITHISPQP